MKNFTLRLCLLAFLLIGVFFAPVNAIAHSAQETTYNPFGILAMAGVFR